MGPFVRWLLREPNSHAYIFGRPDLSNRVCLWSVKSLYLMSMVAPRKTKI